VTEVTGTADEWTGRGPSASGASQRCSSRSSPGPAGAEGGTVAGRADVCELCPPHDRDGQTARLAALTVWEILRGLAGR